MWFEFKSSFWSIQNDSLHFDAIVVEKSISCKLGKLGLRSPVFVFGNVLNHCQTSLKLKGIYQSGQIKRNAFWSGNLIFMAILIIQEKKSRNNYAATIVENLKTSGYMWLNLIIRHCQFDPFLKKMCEITVPKRFNLNWKVEGQWSCKSFIVWDQSENNFWD